MADPDAARRPAEQPVMAWRGPAGVPHAVTDVVVDAHTDGAARVRADPAELERSVFSPARQDLTERICSLTGEVVEFRDAVRPLVPVMRSSTPADDDHDLLGSVLDAHLDRGHLAER
ncbi:hypothetical protein AB0D38_30020 [Streptomyces sp. NPDC048279]|uniref:hypothetical protein n=1 Tax=Streptomyces sp. NPDC048279 TaxID=3154714 RepID=UPI003425D658